MSISQKKMLQNKMKINITKRYIIHRFLPPTLWNLAYLSRLSYVTGPKIELEHD